MPLRKVRLPDEDFTFCIDGDGLPRYRGATSEGAVPTVHAMIEFAQKWIELMQEPNDQTVKRAQQRELSEAISALSSADRKALESLQNVAMQLRSLGTININSSNIDAVRRVSTDIRFTTTVQRLLIRWAELYI